VDDLYLRQRMPYGRGRARYWRHHPWQWLKAQAANWLWAGVLLARLMSSVPDPALRREYRRRVWGVLKARRDPAVLVYYLLKCAMHYHAQKMARRMADRPNALVNSF
jgi:hypothetical protein